MEESDALWWRWQCLEPVCWWHRDANEPVWFGVSILHWGHVGVFHRMAASMFVDGDGMRVEC